MADYYNVLGVERGATKEDIKRAYRKKAHQFHPDKDGGDEEKFKEVNAAYQVLSDDAKRSQYDQFGSTFEDAGAGSGGPGFGGFSGFNVNVEDLGGMGDIFEQFFGGQGPFNRSQGKRVRRGEDVSIDTTISMQESADGVTREITTRLHQACEHCRGSAAEPGTPIVDCSTCGGKGVVQTTRQTVLGVFAQNSVCSACQGDGKQAKEPCTVCRGEGRQMRERTLEVTIPAGIEDGQTIRLSGKGAMPPRGGVAGDLYVTVHVQAQEGLRRDGQTARSSVTVSFAEAALGTTREVETLHGTQELQIPAGTQPGEELRLRGEGFAALGGSARGDHVVTVQVAVPKKLSRKQQELLRQFEGAKKRGLFG